MMPQPSRGGLYCREDEARMETYVGFDSAWTDNPKAPGALCAIRFEENGVVRFFPPRPASFTQALSVIQELHAASAVTILALDQPTLVPNATGMRPVERVAASLISLLGGGVQPANRSRLGMFCDASPIWPFLRSLNAIEDPELARVADAGLFLMEVFPALALASLDDRFFGRLSAPRYNPERKKTYHEADWGHVAEAAAVEADALGCNELAAWCRQTAQRQPRKADQDMLDSALCVLIALRWRRRPRNESLLLGDMMTGYMVVPASRAVRERLSSAAHKHLVPVDGVLPADELGSAVGSDRNRFVASASDITMLGRIESSESRIRMGYLQDGTDGLFEVEYSIPKQLIRIAIAHLRRYGNSPESILALGASLQNSLPGIDVVMSKLRALPNGGAYFDCVANRGRETMSITLNRVPDINEETECQ
jgi:predicted RNase H-like nuclease